LSFTELAQALEIAAEWAKATHGVVWRAIDGDTFRMATV
jgi:hypothetical protein